MSASQRAYLDVRESDEFDHEHIPDSVHVPLSRFSAIAPGVLANLKADEIVLVCQSGARANFVLSEAAAWTPVPKQVSVLPGGLSEWKRQGQPVRTRFAEREGRLPLIRQVHLAAGLLLLTASLLAWFVSPKFIWLAGAIGAGLTLSGATGFCGMAMILTRMPWNRVAPLFLAALFSATAHAASVPGEYLIKLRGPAVSAEKLSKSLNAKIVRFLPRTDLVLVQRSTRERPETALRALRSRPEVAIAEPNLLLKLDTVPNDARFAEMWTLKNTGQRAESGKLGTPGMDIGVEKAWDLSVGSSEIVVAVVDTGMKLDHPDLAANLYSSKKERDGQAGADDDDNGYVDDVHGYDFVNRDADPTDDHWHGTHVSGTIGASGNNGLGIVGVNWQVSLLPLKAFDSGGGGKLSSAIEAIHYAIHAGARVINASWGGDTTTPLLTEAIAEAARHEILFVAAAGNDSADNDRTPHFPANTPLPNVVSVAAVDSQGALADFSCYGRRSVHLAAPGESVLSSTPAGYSARSGTSMATPHVTGVAALVLSREPTLKAAELRERLIRTAQPLASLYKRVASNGLVNATYALRNELAPADPEDPKNWEKTIALSISTEHPYRGDTHQTWDIRVPAGAREFALYFERFETEDPYDRLTFVNDLGTDIASYGGTEAQGWIGPFRGVHVRVRFTSNNRGEFYGFDLVKAAYR